MATRLELQAALEVLLGSRNVYFQPPETVKMKYPCFVYSRSTVDTTRADDIAYLKHPRYMVTFISDDPDTNGEMVHSMLDRFPYCTHDRFYTANNLSHDVFDLYF